MRMNLREIADAVGGQLEPGTDTSGESLDLAEIVVTGAVADSRKATPGDLYVAIVGERVDGHDFASAAAETGAVAVLGSRPTALPTIVVADPVVALGALATHHLAGLPDATLVAITGSSGKTTTKDLIGDVLSRLGPTVAPIGSFNTEVGMPLTILTADEETKHLVLEMGARGKGHIALLCQIAPPQISVALNVGTAHLGEFGGRQAIAEAKSEIVQGPSVRTAILNADDPNVAGMAAVTSADVLTFGESATADIRAEDVRMDERACASYTLNTPAGSATVQLKLVGEHMVSNSLAAAAVAHTVGIPVADIADALSNSTAKSRWRMEITTTAGGVTIINDSYNANPDSMRAALKALMGMKSSGRTWAVLGEMKELGEDSVDEHDSLGRLVVRLDVSRLIAVGEGARPIHLGASHEGSWGNESAWVPDAEQAIEVLRRELAPGDVVLIKASRSIGLEKVAEALSEEAAS